MAAKEAGFVQVPPTLVTYTPGEDEARQSVSSPTLPFRTFTIGESLVAKVSHGSLASWCTLFPDPLAQPS